MARKGKKRAKVTCLACDSKMGKKDVSCRRCGAGRPGYFKPGAPGASKAVFQPVGAAAFITKSARPGTSHADLLRADLLAAWRNSPDPAEREASWNDLFGGHLGGGQAS